MPVRQPERPRHRLSDRTAVAAVVLAVASCAAGSFWWIYGWELVHEPPIRSDATGYYLYLPALLLDHDVTLERTARRSFAGREYAMWGVRRIPPDDRFIDKYTVGEAIMLSPFFAVGHAAARLCGATPNGFSTPYQVTAAGGGLVYALLGIAQLGFLLLRLFSRSTVVVTLVAITFGTALFHYATYDAVFSHAFSFFLVATILRLALAVYDQARLLTATALGSALGLLTVVRPTNSVVLVFVALVGVTSFAELRRRPRAVLRHPRLLAAGAGAFVIPLLPQLAYWHTITEKLYYNAYVYEHLDLLHPQMLNVLFSVRKGLFFWAPLLVLAVAGLRYLPRYAKGLVVPAGAYLAVSTWVISSWTTWWYGGSLGQRAFVESLPVFALGLASLVETVRGRIGRWVLAGTMTVTTLLAAHAMVAYWLQEVPDDRTTWTVYINSFRMWLPG